MEETLSIIGTVSDKGHGTKKKQNNGGGNDIATLKGYGLSGMLLWPLFRYFAISYFLLLVGFFSAIASGLQKYGLQKIRGCPLGRMTLNLYK